MPKFRAKLDPLLLSSSGRRVEFLNLKFPLVLGSLDDINLEGAVPGDAIVYQPDLGGWVPGSTTINVNTESAGGSGSSLGQDILIRDNGINPKGVLVDNLGVIQQEYLIAQGGYPYTDASWNNITTFDFGDNLEVDRIELNSQTAMLTAHIKGTDPVLALYVNSGAQTINPDGSVNSPGPLSIQVRELNFVGTAFQISKYPSQHYGGAEQVMVELN